MARKILLADDSVTAQNMGRKILADAGYDVVTVNNGSAALKRITEIKPDLIVLDVYMPGYSGLEVCQRLKDAPETAHIPVLLTVGKLEPFKPEEARRVRADAHIVKPFEASELLTAITKLEDRMVPQQSDGRFSTSVSGVERFGGDGRKSESEGETDTGWKSRLRFPSKKKKEEPEPELDESGAGATFRDFRKGKGKTGASAPFTVKPPAPAGQEPGLVPDIPRDITPDELDALSALAAKLDGPIPAAENLAPLAEKMGPASVSAPEVATPKAEEVKAEAEVPAVVAEAKAEVTPESRAKAHPEPKIKAKKDEVAAVIESANHVEIPVAHTEPAADAVEAPGLLVVVPVKTASLAEEPAPVDRTDEPRFASVASAVEQVAEAKSEVQAEVKAEVKAEEKISEQTEEKPVEAVAKTEVTEAAAPVEAVAKAEESQAAELKQEEAKAEAEPEAPKVAAVEQPVAASAPATHEPEEPAPSDEELAEALRLLTPKPGATEGSTIPSHGTLVAAGQLLAEEAARNAATAPRWIAEPVALTPEEASISLEAEMFRTFATTPAAVPATITGSEMEAVGVTGVSAIAAAIENRLASMDSAASGKASGERGAVEASAKTDVETPAVSNATPSAADATAQEPAFPEKNDANKIAAEQKDSAAKAAEEAPVEEPVSATFADAMSKNEVEETMQQKTEPVTETAAGAEVATEHQDSSSEAGSEESMGKDGKWHQIHKTPAGAPATGNVVEAAKQAEGAAEESPKAMAAAAAEGSSFTSATDAGAIASIVDSVMADLRPKIVEEIAKKLAGK